MRRSDDYAIHRTCDICEFPKRCGPHVYEGHGVRLWGFWVCYTCRLTGDVPPAYEKRVVQLLAAKGITFHRNRGGCIIIPD